VNDTNRHNLAEARSLLESFHRSTAMGIRGYSRETATLVRAVQCLLAYIEHHPVLSISDRMEGPDARSP
jgi:hypothetical protein